MDIIKKLWFRITTGLLTAVLIASLILLLLPKVEISSEGKVSISNYIVLAASTVVYDTSTIDESDGSSDPSFSHTITGSDVALLVFVGTGKGNSLTVNGITYNAVSLTFVRREAFDTDAIAEVWKLAAPATGTNTVVVDVDTTLNTDPLIVVAMSFTGADQTDPVSNHAGAQGADNPATVDVTSEVNEMVADMYAEIEGPDAPSVGPGQTERERNTSTGPEPQVAASTEPGASTVTMSWNIDTEWVIVAASIRVAYGEAPPSESGMEAQII